MPQPDGLHPFASHSRRFEHNEYVYPVLSRRAGGLSIGVNLNPDRVCTFNCVYCQVDRTGPPGPSEVDPTRLAVELDAMSADAASGRIFETLFHRAPAGMRRWNDIAMSGDGEPTLCRRFEEAVAVCAAARKRHAPADVKIVLITNATTLDRDTVRRGLAILDANQGEIWAKLDAGTNAYFRKIDRSRIPFDHVLSNLADTARARPIVIQSLFLRSHGQPPDPAEIDAYCSRLSEIVASGGQIKLVQVHTVARPPAEPWVSSLSAPEVDAIADSIRRQTGLAVAAFYGR